MRIIVGDLGTCLMHGNKNPLFLGTRGVVELNFASFFEKRGFNHQFDVSITSLMFQSQEGFRQNLTHFTTLLLFLRSSISIR